MVADERDEQRGCLELLQRANAPVGIGQREWGGMLAVIQLAGPSQHRLSPLEIEFVF
jgi:hypothetical protein